MAESDPFPSLDLGLEEVVLDDDLNYDLLQFVTQTFGFAWGFDFDAGDFQLTPQGASVVLEGVEAVRQWCRHVLSVNRGETPIIGASVGVDLESLLGGQMGDPYITARITQEVEQALVLHDRVESVKVRDVTDIGNSTFVTVEIVLDTGEVIQDTMGLG